MTDSRIIAAETPPPTNTPAGSPRPQRLPSPAEPAEQFRRPESDPDLWVAVAAELAE